MEYIIVYLIKGKAQKYQKELTSKISRKFKIRNLNYHVPQHITLKNRFTPKNIKKVETLIKSFCEKQSLSKIKIKGFGNFEERVFYLNVEFSKKAKEIYKNLLKSLKKIKSIEWKEHDGLGNFHATLGYAKDKKQFKEMKKFTSDRTPKYDLKFDNITILKRLKKNWKVHKSFKIR